jgi:DNA-binding transcriptional LysR family regulator
LRPELLNEYRSQYPKIEIHIDEGPDQDVKQWILDRRIDVGFVVFPEERFETYVVYSDGGRISTNCGILVSCLKSDP